ncbi:MAG: DUF4860 domain-containing protein [Lachnospiraceae bacterium]|nr:DUF4860 domain-containing protein [Lachnospiraceae bacterium]
MTDRKNSRGQTVSVLFTMLLFLVFVMCALFTVLCGGKVYENISSRMEHTYTGSVALQYIATKVRQGDVAGQISLSEEEGQPVLELSQEIGGERYVTWIYYLDGSIRELFTYADSGLTLQDGLRVLDCEGLVMEQTGDLLHVETTGEGGGALYLSLRSTGGQDE